MALAPLCIVQARYHSTRLPGKMLLELGGKTLIARAWRIACEAFGRDNCVVAIPQKDADGPLGDALCGHANVFAWDGPENDVLGRFYHCAHFYRWHPDSIIVRYTPDDPFKTVDGLRRVAAGERLPVEWAGEAFTLAMLDEARWTYTDPEIDADEREHITYAIFGSHNPPPPPPPGAWTIDTEADYEAAKAKLISQSCAAHLYDTVFKA